MNNYLLNGFIISFTLSTFLFIFCIPILRKIKIGQSIRSDGPSSHLIKKGTPTMGGIIMLLGFSLSFIIVGVINLNISILNILSFLFPCYVYLLIGFIDDLIIIIKEDNKGIKAIKKIIFQIIAIFLYYFIFLLNHNTIIDLYFIKVDLKQFYFLFILLLYVSTTNAVNLTDGLDGLACGILIICFIATTILGLIKSRNDISLFSVTVLSSLLSFLIFNYNPAKIFMGNSGSLMFGAILATIFVLLEEEMMIIIIGFIFILETLSVIIQVLYFKITKGKRFFLMAPLHHHFEQKGNNEILIDFLFWIVALISVIFSLIFLL